MEVEIQDTRGIPVEPGEGTLRGLAEKQNQNVPFNRELGFSQEVQVLLSRLLRAAQLSSLTETRPV